jgi:site-specific DNA-methyltransferase (adenine-specific)
MAKERLGYPTQKPLSLIERIIQASSNECDVVMDPFCGCGTAIVAAEKLRRKWIGIDITVLAVNLIEKRLKEHFPDAKFKLVGVPCDVVSAEKLASTRDGKFLFEQWFITSLRGQPYKSTGGGDTGIDGFMYFKDLDGKSQTVIVSVKGGSYTVGMIRDLKAVVDREEASMGLLLALRKPTKGMLAEAASAGRFQMLGLDRTYPKVQIFTVEDYFKGIRPDKPDTSATLKKAKREIRESEKPQKLNL